MREYPGHRLGRLLAILAALAGGERTRAELARLFATSERTVQVEWVERTFVERRT